MSDIKIEKLSAKQREEMGIYKWPIWKKEVSRFDWHYDAIEQCYILEGEAVVETKGGEKVSFSAGDFVTFPNGLDCVWDIKKAIRKHYNFKY